MSKSTGKDRSPARQRHREPDEESRGQYGGLKGLGPGGGRDISEVTETDAEAEGPTPRRTRRAPRPDK